MVPIKATEFPVFFEERFAGMVIPGNGNRIAVSRESMCEIECVAIGETSDGWLAVRTKGNDRFAKRTIRISSAKFDRIAEKLDCEFKKSGLLFAKDILDGETYLVKWSEGTECVRLVLGNPRQLNNPALRVFANTLDRFLSFA